MDNENIGRRIAKNTMALYFRMLFLLVVSLYVNRVVLAELGEEDFGIFNVVGGIVPILLFITTAIANATQRFFNVEIGKGGDITELRRVFATTCLINIILTVVIVLLSETLGLWFVNNCMNFRPERMSSVNWVFQYSVINCIPGILFASYLSSIICHEHMTTFAWLSVFEALIKLAFVFVLPFIPIMKLEFFTLMTLTISALQSVFYIVYSRKSFAECRQLSFNLVTKESLQRVLSFTSWSVLGVLDTIIHIQGIAVLVNIFFGTIVNAAFGITNQLNNVVKRFVQSFMTAFTPHVVKSYSAGKIEDMHECILRGCRISLILISLIVIPLIIEAPGVMAIWLKEVPEYAVILVRMILIVSLIDSSTDLLNASIGATGRIKWYNIVVTGIGLIHVLMTYAFFRLGYAPYSAMIIYIVVISFIQVGRFVFNIHEVSLPADKVLSQYVLRGIFFISVAFLVSYSIHSWLRADSITQTLLSCVLSLLSTLIIAVFFMLMPSERQSMVVMIKNKLFL